MLKFASILYVPVAGTVAPLDLEEAAVIQAANAHVDGPALERLADLTWIADIPAMGAARCPDRPAVIFSDRKQTTSYRDLNRGGNAFAALMRSRGIEAGDRIAYLGRNSDLFYLALFGAILAGCVLVPINWRLAAPEIRYLLQDSRARLLICDPEFKSVVQRVFSELDRPPQLLSTEADDCDTGLRAALRTGEPQLHEIPHDPDQVVLQLYTSGTTGRPKGVLISHRALSLSRHAELNSPHLAHLERGCSSVSAMPNFHIGGISWVLMGLVRLGTVVITADSSAVGLLGLLREYEARHIFIVPTVVRAIVDELRSTKAPAPKLTGIYYGAMPMDEKLLRDTMDIFNCCFVHFFGMTENSGSATFLAPEDHSLSQPEKLESVGKPYPGMSVEIRGADRRLLKSGEHGEIWVKSPTLMLGYWNMPENTSAAIVDGWYATGDGGYLDNEGFLFLTDRIKDMIISGGENIYPIEVEEVLRRHAAVFDAAVVGQPDARWGEIVIAFVQLRPGADVTAEELLTFARQHIAGYKCPKLLRFMNDLPRTASGKVQRAKLRQRDQSETQIHTGAS